MGQIRGENTEGREDNFFIESCPPQEKYEMAPLAMNNFKISLVSVLIRELLILAVNSSGLTQGMVFFTLAHPYH